jgi:hypothetical protein
MSLVPIGYANDTSSCFETNEDIVYGGLLLETFPDPLVKSVQSTYVLKTGNPLKAGQKDQYSVNVTILLDISTPSNEGGNKIRSCVGGIPYLFVPLNQTNPGDGNTGPPPNPTQITNMTYTSTLINSTSAEINITGNCIVLAENGIKIGILYSGDTVSTTEFNVTNILYNYRYLGPQP